MFQLFLTIVVTLHAATLVMSNPMWGGENSPSPPHEVDYSQYASSQGHSQFHITFTPEISDKYSNFPTPPHDKTSLPGYPYGHSTSSSHPQYSSTQHHGDNQVSHYGSPYELPSPFFSQDYQQYHDSQQPYWAHDPNANSFNEIAMQNIAIGHTSSPNTESLGQSHRENQGTSSSLQQEDEKDTDDQSQERPIAELANRPFKYNTHHWQRVHTEAELDKVYLSIVKRWGSQPKVTKQETTYPALNDFFKNNPDKLAAIIAGKEDIIETVANDFEPQHPPRQLFDDYMTVKEFMKWLQYKRKNRVNYFWDRPSWAFSKLTEDRSIRLIGRLNRQWKKNSSEVRALLEYVEPSVLESFYPRLFLSNDKTDQRMAADELYKYIMRKMES